VVLNRAYSAETGVGLVPGASPQANLNQAFGLKRQGSYD